MKNGCGIFFYRGQESQNNQPYNVKSDIRKPDNKFIEGRVPASHPKQLGLQVTEFDWSNRPREEDSYPPTDVRDAFQTKNGKMWELCPNA